jgi:hypothetical protein
MRPAVGIDENTHHRLNAHLLHVFADCLPGTDYVIEVFQELFKCPRSRAREHCVPEIDLLLDQILSLPVRFFLIAILRCPRQFQDLALSAYRELRFGYTECIVCKLTDPVCLRFIRACQ